MAARFDPSDIRRFYDRHTPAFVALGQGGSLGAIHRAVWGPGVTTRPQAFRYVEERILEMLRRLPSASDDPRHVVDLGCGVGASLCYLAERLPIRGTGITLSPVQARIAGERIRAAGLTERVTCLEGDFTDPPSALDRADLAFAIESFVHGPEPERFFARCRDLLRPGGALVICDDFRRPTADPPAARAIARFREGWHINTLVEPDTLRRLARAAGFAHAATTDLSPHLELRRMRDRLAGLALAVVGRLPSRWVSADRVDYLQGGHALQECLRRGWIGYDLAVFRREA